MVYYFTSNTVSPSAHIYVGKDKVENEELIKYGWEEDIWVRTTSTLLLPTFAQTRNKNGQQAATNERTNNTSDPQFHADNLSSAHIYLRLPSPSASSATGSTSTTTTATTATSAPPSLPGTHPEEPPTNTYSWERIPPDLLADLAQLTKANSIEGNKKDNVTVVYTPWTNLRKDGGMAVGQVGFRDERKVRKILVPARQNPIVNRLNKTRVERFPDLRAEREDRRREVRKLEQASMQERRREEARVARERKEKAWAKDHAYDDLFAEEEVMRSSNQDRGEDFLDDFM